MGDSCIGLWDKLYWRTLDTGVWRVWHCFARDKDAGGFVSLCGQQRVTRVGGQAIDRPPPIQRCALCDGREATRRGKDESMPARPARVHPVAS